MPTLSWHKLEEAVAALSYGDAASENAVIQGNNLDAPLPSIFDKAFKGEL